MFDCGYKSQYIGGQREKFVRLDDLDSRLSFSSDKGVNKADCLANNTSKTFKSGMKKGSEGLKSIGRSLRFGVSRAVFPEDLKVSEKKIFDPQDKFLQLWNKLSVISCILAVSVDPLFFYLPVFDDSSDCLGIDRKLAITATTLRTVIDAFYFIHMALQFRTAYIAPSSRVFGRGELVIDPAQIAKRYLRRYFIIDFLAVLPLPQIVVWRFLQRSRGSDVLATKQALFFIVLLQYIPRFFRIVPLTSELKRTAGVFAETAWAGAAYYLLLYMLASHIVGAFWYVLAVERNDACWRKACTDIKQQCNTNFLYCGNQQMIGYDTWSNISKIVLDSNCSAVGDNPPFDYGIYQQALTSGIVSSKKFISKYCYCLWWGLQNLSTLGQGLATSTYPGEVIFSISLAILGLILFALLIGNMQTYLQSLTIRLEEMRVKRRDSEQWMHHRLLPQDLRERVRRYDQYKWLETRGVDEENLVQSLPKDLRRDIKRHLCLALVRRVPLFENMDERLLDAICERLKPSLYTENTYIVREGDPVDEMLFIIRGRLESGTTDGGRSGFFRRCYLQEGDFCGEELLTWALDPKSGSNLPSSTQTVKALTEVEAFALIAEEMKFVAGQFRHLHGRRFQRTFRFYSQQWRTWAACYIQVAWWRYSKRKIMELRRKEEVEAEGLGAARNNAGGGSYSLGATFLASKFAANALRGVHRNRISKTTRQTRNLELAKMAPGEKKKLDWNDNGRPIGAFASKFANYIGAVVRAEENVPLEVTTWKAMPKEKKQKCYDKVRDKFEYEETEDRKAYLMKDLGVKFREYRHTLRKAYRSFTSDRQRLANPPENVSTRAWSWLVTYWSSREYQALCARNRANRRRLRSLHCTGSKSFARIIHERTNDTGVVPTRKVVHFKTRTKRGGRPVNDHVAAIMAKMTQLAAPPEEDGSQPLTDDEIWAKTFPPDKSGRVMCMGSNVTTSQMFGRRRAREQQHREEVNSLRSQLASTQSRLESTEKELVQTKSTMEVYEQNQAKQREELNGLRGQLDLILGALQGRGLNLDCGMRAPSSGGSSCA